jgi:hypothetical protein
VARQRVIPVTAALARRTRSLLHTGRRPRRET